MNVHENVYEAVKRFRQPVTASVIQSETNPKLNYAIVLNCLNELVRSGRITESKNEVDKRVFKTKER